MTLESIHFNLFGAETPSTPFVNVDPNFILSLMIALFMDLLSPNFMYCTLFTCVDVYRELHLDMTMATFVASIQVVMRATIIGDTACKLQRKLKENV